MSRNGPPPSHLMLQHGQAVNVRKCLGQEFEKLAGVDRQTLSSNQVNKDKAMQIIVNIKPKL